MQVLERQRRFCQPPAKHSVAGASACTKDFARSAPENPFLGEDLAGLPCALDSLMEVPTVCIVHDLSNMAMAMPALANPEIKVAAMAKFRPSDM